MDNSITVHVTIQGRNGTACTNKPGSRLPAGAIRY